MASPTLRIGKLDSVRGVASLMVVVGHCGGLISPSEPSDYWWMALLWDGQSAVVMFFLLSGYVLALQLGSERCPTFRQYLIRRFMRIWPAYIVVIMATWVLFVVAAVPIDAGPNHGPPQVPNWNDLVNNLFMYKDEYAIDPPVWSLYVEARLSLVFPLLFLLTRRLSAVWAILISMVLSAGLSRMVHWQMPDLVASFASAGRYTVLFVGGAVLAQVGNPIERSWRATGPVVRAIALGIAIACLLYRFASVDGIGLPFANYVSWCGVGILFVFCLYSPSAEKLLTVAPLFFLGRVSYGVYLSHFPIMLGAQKLVSGSLLTLVVATSSILVGWGINEWIERPTIRMGRRISANSSH